MNIQPIFPSLIVKEKIKDYDKYKDELIRYSYQQQKIDPSGVNKSNEGGWHSQSRYANSQNPISSIVINLIKSILNNKNVFNIKDLSKAKMQMWININKPGDYNTKHNHPGSDLSGVFWVKSLQKSGNLTFYSPNVMTQIQQINSTKEELLYLIKKRSNIYSKALYKIDCDNLTKSEIVNKIIKIHEDNKS